MRSWFGVAGFAFGFAWVLVSPAAATPAPTCCGAFIARTETARFNDALQFVVVRDASHTVVSVQNRYRGPVEEFALLVPVPVVLTADQVHVLDRSVFAAFEQATAPQLYELDEMDPCHRNDRDEAPGGRATGGGQQAGGGPPTVTVETSFAVGEYQIVVLSASDAAGLDGWLRTNGYAIPAGLTAQLRPYVDAGSKFFVAKVDPAKVAFSDGAAQLSPLRFEYDATEISLPMRLSAASSPGIQDVIVYAVADTRLEAANRPNTTIPTNITLTEAAAKDFGGFYAALYRRTVAATPQVVVTERAEEYIVPGEALKMVGVPDAADTGQIDRDRWVVTRLHFQVDRVGPLDDLVLRAAPPISSGGMYDQPVDQGSHPATSNAVSARYMVRHRWTRPVTCADPIWGRWVPARGGGAPPAPQLAVPAADPVERLVIDDIPAIGVKAAQRLPPHPRASGGGCGCRGAGGESSLALVLGLLAVEWRRRRRRCERS